jgi:hypothetical protein
MKATIVVLAMLVGCGNLAFADMAATVDPDEVIWANPAGATAVGWRFFADKAFTITHLGVFDAGDDGLGTTHTLGIWRVNKTGGLTLMRQADIGPGVGTLLDHHRFVDIDDFTITPDPEPWIDDGVAYYERWVVGVWSPDTNVDALILQPRGAATIVAELDGFLHIENQLSCGSGVFTYPWTNQSEYDHFGVNFLYDPVAVPAPGALLLGVIGLAHVGRRLRLRPSQT